MLFRVILVGLTGGLLTAGCLVVPLYLVVPTRFVSDWSGVSPWFGRLGYALSVAAVFMSGYVAARWSHRHAPRRGREAGAIAGLMAGAFAFCLIGAPAAAVVGNSAIYTNGPQKLGNPENIALVVTDAILGITSHTYLAFWAMLVIGGIAGALGGWLSSRESTPGWGPSPAPIGVEALAALAMTLVVQSVFVLVVVVGAVGQIADKIGETMARYAPRMQHSALVAGSVVTWPLLTNICALLVGSWCCWQVIAGRWMHPQLKVNALARLMAIVSPSVVILAIAVLYLLRPELFGDPFSLVSIAGLLALITAFARQAAEAPAVPTPAASEASSAFSYRDVFFGSLGFAVISTLQAIGGGVSLALSLALCVVPFVDVLYRGPQPGVEAPSVATSIQRVFELHWKGSFSIAFVSYVVILILGTVIVAVVRRLARHRGQAPDR